MMQSLRKISIRFEILSPPFFSMLKMATHFGKNASTSNNSNHKGASWPVFQNDFRMSLCDLYHPKRLLCVEMKFFPLLLSLTHLKWFFFFLKGSTLSVKLQRTSLVEN